MWQCLSAPAAEPGQAYTRSLASMSQDKSTGVLRVGALESVVSDTEGTGLFDVRGPIYFQGHRADGPR